MPSAVKSGKGEGYLRAIQVLMCELGADPPGYFDPLPRQPLQWAIVDPELPPMLRCLEWVRFHTLCYDGVPKNTHGDPQRGPYCVGPDGKRLNRLDCARETGLSTSVVNRQFATLERLGYTQVKRDGSIWYRGKVVPRAEAAVRQSSAAECLRSPHPRSTTPARPALQRLVTGRVIPASLLKATQSFPADEQAAVEAHVLEVARWERAEIARQITKVRQEAEQRYQAAAWHGYHLEKDGRRWERAPAQESLFQMPSSSPTASDDNHTCVPEDLFARSSSTPVPQNQQSLRADTADEPTDLSSRAGMESIADASSFHEEEGRAGEKECAVSNVPSHSDRHTIALHAAPKLTPAEAKSVHSQYIRQVFAGTGKGIPTDAQIDQALAHLPPQATPQGFAGFIRDKLPAIRHAGALVRLAQEYAHELRYAPQATVFQCGQCHDQGFVLPGGQFCACLAGLRRRQADEWRTQGTGP